MKNNKIAVEFFYYIGPVPTEFQSDSLVQRQRLPRHISWSQQGMLIISSGLQFTANSPNLTINMYLINTNNELGRFMVDWCKPESF